MNVSRWAVVIIGCLIFFGIGFKAGQFVEAGGVAPGTAGDPLAAKSYVDKAVNDKISGLESQAKDLQNKISSLQQTVSKLEEQANVKSTASEEVKSSSPAVEVKPAKASEKVQTKDENAGKTAVVVSASVNVRKGPGTTFEKVGGLLKGNKVTVLKTENGWLLVNVGNIKGWIDQRLVEIK